MRHHVLVALTAALLSFAASAHAVTFEGEWPATDAPVALDVQNEARAVALRRAAEAAGLDLVATAPLEGGAPVTVHVRHAPLRAVLEAVLGDAPVTVARRDGMIVVRPGEAAPAPGPVPPPAPTASAPEPTAVPTFPPGVPAVPPVPAVPGVPAIPSVPAVPPVPPVPGAIPAALPAMLGSSAWAPDRTTFGDDVHIRTGERVHDVVTMGGDLTVEGEVTGSATTMGGDVHVRRGGIIRGDLVTMGGDVTIDDGGLVLGRRVGLGGAGKDFLATGGLRHRGGRGAPDEKHSGVPGALVNAALLFLFGLLLMNVAPARLGALQRTLVRVPVRAAGTGLLGLLGAIVLAIVLAITIVGIPAALIVLLAVPLALYIGMAAVASVIGAALPLAWLNGRPVRQLLAGVVVMTVVAAIPVIGPLALGVSLFAGLGAVVLTRFKDAAPGDVGAPPSIENGPYRTQGA